jgi:hypothetical protein
MAQHRHGTLVILPFFTLNQNIAAGTAGIEHVKEIDFWLCSVVNAVGELFT